MSKMWSVLIIQLCLFRVGCLLAVDSSIAVNNSTNYNVPANFDVVHSVNVSQPPDQPAAVNKSMWLVMIGASTNESVMQNLTINDTLQASQPSKELSKVLESVADKNLTAEANQTSPQRTAIPLIKEKNVTIDMPAEAFQNTKKQPEAKEQQLGNDIINNMIVNKTYSAGQSSTSEQRIEKNQTINEQMHNETANKLVESIQSTTEEAPVMEQQVKSMTTSSPLGQLSLELMPKSLEPTHLNAAVKNLAVDDHRGTNQTATERPVAVNQQIDLKKVTAGYSEAMNPSVEGLKVVQRPQPIPETADQFTTKREKFNQMKTLLESEVEEEDQPSAIELIISAIENLNIQLSLSLTSIESPTTTNLEIQQPTAIRDPGDKVVRASRLPTQHLQIPKKLTWPMTKSATSDRRVGVNQFPKSQPNPEDRPTSTGNVVAFHAIRDENSSPCFGIVNYPKIHLTGNNVLNPTNGIFTAPVDGLYVFVLSCQVKHAKRNPPKECTFIHLLRDGKRIQKESVKSFKNVYNGDSLLTTTVVVNLKKGNRIWTASYDSSMKSKKSMGHSLTFAGLIVHSMQ